MRVSKNLKKYIIKKKTKRIEKGHMPSCQIKAKLTKRVFYSFQLDTRTSDFIV